MTHALLYVDIPPWIAQTQPASTTRVWIMASGQNLTHSSTWNHHDITSFLLLSSAWPYGSDQKFPAWDQTASKGFLKTRTGGTSLTLFCIHTDSDTSWTFKLAVLKVLESFFIGDHDWLQLVASLCQNKNSFVWWHSLDQTTLVCPS